MNRLYALALLICVVLLSLAGCAQATEMPTATPNPPTVTPEPTSTPEPELIAVDDPDVARMVANITWLRSTNMYGHTGIMIQTDDLVVYLDPVDLVGIEELPKADIVLISHGHDDHASKKTVIQLVKENTTIITTAQVSMMFQDEDVEAIFVKPDETIDVGGLEIATIPAYNSYHNRDYNYLGFIFSIDGVNIYCSGDTDFNPEMAALTDIDIAVMNVRNPYSLTGEEVVAFVEQVAPMVVIPIHWMPGVDTYDDDVEIAYIQENLPETTVFAILDPKPEG
jgi:L-ascorbate metabolism protein UlaG (beta-lactamase superfamily)